MEKTTLNYDQLKRLVEDTKDKMKNAKAFADIPTQKYRSEWEAEYEFYKEMLETLEQMFKENFCGE